MLQLKKKNNKEKQLQISLFYILHTKTLNDMIYNSWGIEQDRLKLLILGHFYPPKNQKDILKKWKNCWRYHHFTHVYQKSQSYNAWFLKYGVRQTSSFVILGHCFALLPHKQSPKSKFRKKWKEASGDLLVFTSVP